MKSENNCIVIDNSINYRGSCSAYSEAVNYLKGIKEINNISDSSSQPYFVFRVGTVNCIINPFNTKEGNVIIPKDLRILEDKKENKERNKEIVSKLHEILKKGVVREVKESLN